MKTVKLNIGVSIERNGHFEPVAYFSQESRARKLAQMLANETRLSTQIDVFDRVSLRGRTIWAEMPKRKVNGKTIPESSVPVVMTEWASILDVFREELKGLGIQFRIMSSEARNVAIRTY